MGIDAKDLGECSKDQQKPQLDKPYWVQCKGYRTMAVFRSDGKWMGLGDNKKLLNVLSFTL